MSLMKPLLAISVSAALTMFCPKAQAQYDSFNAPLGFYLDYGCASQEGLEDLTVTLFTAQGGLFLASKDEDFPQFWVGSRALGPLADYDEFGEPWAWEYTFTGHSEDEALSYDIVLLDQWDSDDSEYLQVTQYVPALEGNPRAPVVLNYVCEVTGGGVNPFL
ncbi:MAG: hypothetical protein KTR27_17005 [Leptolyngbyaceae cyanobacterium MAG.088]|nr:hypothetical protein [Leptolyngbyaceae cyanobacterium MAG.088]